MLCGSEPLPAKAEEAGSDMRLQVTRGDQTDNLIFKQTGSPMDRWGIKTDALVTIFTREGNTINEAVLVNGTYLQVNDVSLRSNDNVNLRWSRKDNTIWISAPVGMPEGQREIRIGSEKRSVKVSSDTALIRL